MTATCCLCGNNGLELIDTIRSLDIIKIYKHLFGINVAEYFEGNSTLNYYKCNNCELQFFFPQVSGGEQFYDYLQQFDWYYTKHKAEFEYAKQYVKPDDHVLEVGCGSGWFGKMLEQCNYVGLEVNAKAQLSAVANSQNVIKQTIEEHSVNNKKLYDVVCSFQVLEHVTNPESFVRSCVDCLKPGGLLIISVPSEDSYLAVVEDGVLNMPPHHVTRWTDKTLTWMAGRHNLEIVSLIHEPLSDIHIHGYATEMVRAFIKKAFHLKTQLASTTLSHRFLTFLCQIVGNCYSKLFLNRSIRPVGDSVTIVSKKNTSV